MHLRKSTALPRNIENNRRWQQHKYQRNKLHKPFWQKCSSLKGKCTQFNLPFDLTPEFLEQQWTGKCALSGTDIKLWADRSDDQTAELDRIIPSLGYIQSNVIWVSRRFNRIKADGTADEHRLIAERIDALRKEYAVA